MDSLHNQPNLETQDENTTDHPHQGQPIRQTRPFAVQVRIALLYAPQTQIHGAENNENDSARDFGKRGQRTHFLIEESLPILGWTCPLD